MSGQWAGHLWILSWGPPLGDQRAAALRSLGVGLGRSLRSSWVEGGLESHRYREAGMETAGERSGSPPLAGVGRSADGPGIRGGLVQPEYGHCVPLMPSLCSHH